jgi:hypothetical protein
MSTKPVFLDETGRRWRVVRLVLLAGVTALIAMPLILILSIRNVGVTPERSLGHPESSADNVRPIGSWFIRSRYRANLRAVHGTEEP